MFGGLTEKVQTLAHLCMFLATPLLLQGSPLQQGGQQAGGEQGCHRLRGGITFASFIRNELCSRAKSKVTGLQGEQTRQ